MAARPHLLFFSLACPLIAFADNVLRPGTPQLDRPTLTAIGVKLPITGDDNFNARVDVRYRKSGTSAWLTGLPLHRVHSEKVVQWTVEPQFAGSIFDLLPATTYEIELTAADPDGGGQTFVINATTRAVPKDPVNPRQVPVSSVAGFRSALSNARPGDIITLANGTYTGIDFILFPSGAAENPIVIRGQSQSGVILDGGGAASGNILEVYGSYVHVERMTIQNGFQALRFLSQTERNVARRLHIRNTRFGIGTWVGQRDFYIADNILEGRLSWPLTNRDDGGRYTDEDGIKVHGSGHVIAHNRLSGFGDALKVGQAGSRAVDFYGNDVLWSYDNGIELDQSEGNARALRNRLTNTFMPLSAQPVLGGPAYIVRNIAVNSADSQIKYQATWVNSVLQEPVGMLAYHNTFVSPYRALNLSTVAEGHYFALHNNLFVGPASPVGSLTVNWEAYIDNGIFDYNGYYPDGRFQFLYRSGYVNYPNFAAMQTGGKNEANGTLLFANVFASGLTAPATHTAQLAPQDVRLAAASNAIDRGLVLPNINDGFSGLAPDLGAIEYGAALPVYGPRPEGVDESAPTAPPPCTYSLSPASANVPSQGGPGTLQLITGTGCSWVAASNAAWISVASSGSGPAAISYVAGANDTVTPRTGTIGVGGQTFTVQQAGLSCSYSITPVSVSAAASGMNGAVQITTGAGCSWIAASQSLWITVSGGTAGTGNGTATFVVAANTGVARTGTLTVAGRTVTVQQQAAPLNPPAPTMVRVNAGGPAFTDAQGNVWSADSGFSGGTAASTAGTVTGTLTPELYRTERTGTSSFVYLFNLPNGKYQMTLKFAETEFTSAGARVFDVNLNNTFALRKFDIFAAAGGANRVYDRTFTFNVTNGQVRLDFLPRTGKPKINAIGIIPVW